jgi:hypothetical protein
VTLEEITAGLQQHFPQGAVVFIIPASGKPAVVQTAQVDAEAPLTRPGSAAAYSREERDILAVLNREVWCTRKEISRATGLPPEGDVKVILRNLVARGVLESSTNHGYRLAPGAPDPETSAL